MDPDGEFRDEDEGDDDVVAHRPRCNARQQGPNASAQERDARRRSRGAGERDDRRDLPAKPPPIVPTYVSERQQQMLAAFENGDYRALAHALYETEQEQAPKPHASRLLNRIDWRPHTDTLLAQLDHDVLRALLSNTLPQLQTRAMDHGLRRADPTMKVLESGIYANWLVDRRGMGVPIDRFEEFLATLNSPPSSLM